MDGYVRLADAGKLGGEQLLYYREYRKRLRSPDCRRILFDARQAALFDELAEAPPENIQRRVHAPFDCFYLEFTEPVLLAAQEPGQQDYAHAILYTGAGLPSIRFAGEPYQAQQAALFLTSPSSLERRDDVLLDKLVRENLAVPQGIQYVDRAWTLRLSEGLALARVNDAHALGSEVPEDWPDDCPDDCWPEARCPLC